MVRIGSFSSVLEIAFAINALLYLFEVAPFSESRIDKKLKEFEELKKQKIEKIKKHYAFPIFFVLSCKYPPTKMFLSYSSIIMSFLSLFLLIYAGFSPNAELSTWLMVVILVLIFSVVPIGAYLTHLKYNSLILSATNELQNEIDEVE